MTSISSGRPRFYRVAVFVALALVVPSITGCCPAGNCKGPRTSSNSEAPRTQLFFLKSIESIQYMGDSWLNLEMHNRSNVIYRIQASELDEKEIRWLRSSCKSDWFSSGCVQVTWYPNSSESDGSREVNYITSIRLAKDR